MLQHAHNPVDWMPWGDAVWRRAKAENKPVFLSIGYSTCHWCHVMERESFESEDVAKVLNRDFISVKVDREERPDVDRVYMMAVQAMTGQGGMASLRLGDTGGKAVLWGDLFSASGRAGKAWVCRCVGSDCGRVEGERGGGEGVGGGVGTTSAGFRRRNKGEWGL